MSILVLTSDTLIGTPATGNLEYNGQFYGTDSALSRAQMQRVAQGTAVTCAGQTSIDYTNLPAWVKKITVMFNAVSTSGTSITQIQLGTGGTPTYTTTGYLSAGSTVFAGTTSTVNSTTGLLIAGSAGAADLRSGAYVLTNFSGNAWVMQGTSALSSGAFNGVGAGYISLGAALTAVRITTVNGTDTFDTTPSAGSINILYEG